MLQIAAGGLLKGAQMFSCKNSLLSIDSLVPLNAGFRIFMILEFLGSSFEEKLESVFPTGLYLLFTPPEPEIIF